MFKPGDLVRSSRGTSFVVTTKQFWNFLERQILLGKEQIAIILKEDFESVLYEPSQTVRQANLGCRFFEVFVFEESKNFLVRADHIELVED
jgi:hypothetical protein